MRTLKVEQEKFMLTALTFALMLTDLISVVQKIKISFFREKQNVCFENKRNSEFGIIFSYQGR